MALIAGVAVTWPRFDPPEMITPPAIMGEPIVGEILRVESVGTWSERPHDFRSIWFVDDIEVEPEGGGIDEDEDTPAWDAPGVNHGELYLIVLDASHEGKTISLEIVARNSAGETTSTRIDIGPVEAAEE